MKIIRFLSEKNQIHYGIPEGSKKKVRPIDGDIFGHFQPTGKRLTVKKILPPLIPPNIIGIGLNYRKHADETNIGYPEIPVMFLKATSAIIGPDDPIILPRSGPDEVDCEGELAVIIGKKVKNVNVNEAMEAVFGFTCANDVSARDWQIKKQKKQWARGKSFDSFCPIGPVLVTKEDIKNPNNLQIQTRINGQLMQDSNTSDMIFNISTIISHISQSLTLLPGTLILTGTPHGVGFTRTPPLFLKKNDLVSIFIEEIGELKNRVQGEL
jgi:2-keto-4-pentenoate hydratase/2-oxohepta-3-ene-1,7-dioic acid hydratase in catechol pathway